MDLARSRSPGRPRDSNLPPEALIWPLDGQRGYLGIRDLALPAIPRSSAPRGGHPRTFGGAQRHRSPKLTALCDPT